MPFYAEPPGDLFARLDAHLRSKRRTPDQLFDRGGPGLGRSGRKEQPVFAGSHYLDRTADVRGDDGHLHRHRLDDRQPERLLPGWHEEDIDRPQDRWDVLALAEEPHGFPE